MAAEKRPAPISDSDESDSEFGEGNPTNYEDDFGGFSESQELFVESLEMIPEEEESSDDSDEEHRIPETASEVQSNSFELPTIPTPSPANWSWNRGSEDVARERFEEVGCGFTVEHGHDWKEFEFFGRTFPEPILNKIVQETNRYAQEHPSNQLDQNNDHFKLISKNELLRYVAIRILMGIEKRPDQAEYWSRDPLLRSYIVPRIMTSERYQEIQRFLHFVDTRDIAGTDVLGKIRPLWNAAMDNFKTLLVPYENLSVDESLTKFRGRFAPRQYIPSKRNRHGIKTFSVVDEETRFVINSVIYEGKSSSVPRDAVRTYGYGGSIILDLCRPYLGRHRTVFMDNYFSSPTLAANLLASQTFMCGTLRANRKHTPKTPKLAKGEVMAYSHRVINNQIVCEFWRDKRIVRMIHTGIGHRMVPVMTRSGSVVQKPLSVTRYNRFARGIDLSDMAISFYDTGRKTKKWSTKMFFRLLDISIYNAFVWKNYVTEKSSLLNFKRNLVRQIIDKTGGLIGRKRRIFTYENGTLARLQGRHFCERFSDKALQCKVCASRKLRSRTMYGCKDCRVPLCNFSCFKDFHTKDCF